jgi:tyrosyl-DNA phosphodiesterase-1
LEESSKLSTSRSDIINIDDSDDEDAQFQADLQRAIDASKASHTSTPSANQVSSSSSFLSERAQLEKERLQRQKRLRGEGDGGDDDDDTEEEAGRPTKRQHISSSPGASRSNGHSVSSAAPSSSQSGPTSNSSSTPTTDQLFWEGELRQTANMHANPRRDGKPTWRLTEILGKVRMFHFDGWISGTRFFRNPIYPLQSCRRTPLT